MNRSVYSLPKEKVTKAFKAFQMALVGGFDRHYEPVLSLGISDEAKQLMCYGRFGR